MTKVLEISVPPQNKFGGIVLLDINATIHGKEPREMLWPRTISPSEAVGTPQVSVFLRDRLIITAEDSVATTNTVITAKNFLIILFTCAKCATQRLSANFKYTMNLNFGRNTLLDGKFFVLLHESPVNIRKPVNLF